MHNYTFFTLIYYERRQKMQEENYIIYHIIIIIRYKTKWTVYHPNSSCFYVCSTKTPLPHASYGPI